MTDSYGFLEVRFGVSSACIMSLYGNFQIFLMKRAVFQGKLNYGWKAMLFIKVQFRRNAFALEAFNHRLTPVFAIETLVLIGGIFISIEKINFLYERI